MRILHIASIKNSSFSGVCVAVPAHIISQQSVEDVALLNITNDRIDGIDHQFVYNGSNWMTSVSTDFASPDIVIFHEVFYIEFPFIAKKIRENKIPYIIIPHGCLVTSALHHKWLKKKIAGLLIFNKFINSASAIQCLSENEKHNTFFKPDKFIGTNGINTPSEIKTNFRKQNIQITYIGRLDIKIKGLDLLLAAINSLRSILLEKNVLINIYGPDVSGSYKTLEKIIKVNDISNIVKLHPGISGEAKKKVLLDSDLFIQVSRHEGMPMGILEALSYGLPCIITNGTALDSIVAKYDAGWVAKTNADSIKTCLLDALSMHDRYNYKSANAITLINENFSWSKISCLAIQQYRSIVDKFYKKTN